VNAEKRCGVVAMLGAPNVGKSTLVNQLVGAKVSIVSPKPQTTRNRISGLLVEANTQLVLLDLPGVFSPRRRFDRAMVAAAWTAAADADVIVVVVDAQRGIDANTTRVIDELTRRKLPAWLVINKVDAVAKPKLLALGAALHRAMVFERSFMVSAASGDGCADLKAALIAGAKAHPWLFPEDQISDLPERLLAAEITSEQVFTQLRQELPYAVAVETESWKDQPDGSARIEQTIYVMREGQRRIVIGEGGTRIKAIGAAAREEIARALGRAAHLFLHVKIAEDWPERREFFDPWGLDYDAR
jgi:GTP-binding protein Era